VAALVRMKQFSVDDVLAKAEAGPLLVIAGLQDPGNLGTILRSAEAFGADVWKVPKEATVEDIHQIKEAFVAAANRAVRAGFQVIICYLLISLITTLIILYNIDSISGSIYRMSPD